MSPTRLRCLALLAATTACVDTASTADDAGSSTSSSSGTTAPATSTTTTAPPVTTDDAADGSSTGAASSETTAEPGTSSETTGGGIDFPEVLCGTTPPEGAEMPAPLVPYSGGTCPPLVPGLNVMSSLGYGRQFDLVVPEDLQPGEQLPLVFLWHWLGGDAQAFLEEADVQNAANQLRIAAIAPHERGDLLFRWPFSAIDSDARLQEELTFFDDMLTCAAESYPIDTTCVSSAGVSAGALFTSQLGWARSEYLSSIIVLSGGVDGFVKPWNGATHIMPAMVLWGGPDDFCIAIDFEQTSHALEADLAADGHPIVECVHNCGHSKPPFEAPFPGVTDFAGMWRFWLDHPFWLADGETPWGAGVPEGTPEWCAMGAGQAVIREGECDGPGC